MPARAGAGAGAGAARWLAGAWTPQTRTRQGKKKAAAQEEHEEHEEDAEPAEPANEDVARTDSSRAETCSEEGEEDGQEQQQQQLLLAAAAARAAATRRRVQEQFWRLRELATSDVESLEDDATLEKNDDTSAGDRLTMGKRGHVQFEFDPDLDDQLEEELEFEEGDEDESDLDSLDDEDEDGDEDEESEADGLERTRRKRRNRRRRHKGSSGKTDGSRDGASLMKIFKERAVTPMIVVNNWTDQVMQSKQLQRIRERRRAGEAELARLRNDFLTSQTFLEMVDQAFEECDIDGNGAIDTGELYAGVLLLYHNLNRIPWGGRKPPPKRAHVLNVMKKYDFNEDEKLDREEFLALCQDLCHNVVLDVTKRILLVIIVFPMLAQPMKHMLQDLFVVARLTPLAALLASVPDQIFTSVAVALMVTLLPYMEAGLPEWLGLRWDDVTDISRGSEVQQFKRLRQRKVMSLRAARRGQERLRARSASSSNSLSD
ncbi:Calcium-binding protein SPEC 1A [Hondaea fermentalgiana]|uniref:Calcium-binding protein SPEC 1A n=1 Tax=Hondaea fermentalgiana TaxID=2315210 RepID=A0A2R5GLW0_9STRA|nr:Calcium-binding protein SPEC 1A [Hondaea fermentalgiana]|eukprot:GBG29271.1 Calcium-binding protein SPEC 1A [Hondaea fermentalgiana]